MNGTRDVTNMRARAASARARRARNNPPAFTTIIFQPGTAVICTSVTTPVRRTFSRARGVFIFVRNFSRGIFLRESLSKVAAGLDSRLDTKWPISVMLSMDTWTVSHSDF